MASRFWVGGSGNWSDNTNHWSASSGGAPGASKPGSADSPFLDANSGGGILTVDETVTVTSFDFTGYTGTFAAGGQTINCFNFFSSGSSTKTIDITSAIINISGQWQLPSTNLTFTSTSSTINVSRQNDGVIAVFVGNGLTFNRVNFNATTGIQRISGNATYAILDLSGSGKTVRFGNGSTHTITSNFIAVGVAGGLITFDTQTAGTFATVTASAGTFNVDYVSIKDNHATGGASWNAGINSINSGGNSGWTFSHVEYGSMMMTL